MMRTVTSRLQLNMMVHQQDASLLADPAHLTKLLLTNCTGKLRNV